MEPTERTGDQVLGPENPAPFTPEALAEGGDKVVVSGGAAAQFSSAIFDEISCRTALGAFSKF